MVNDYSRAYKDIYYILMSVEEKYKNKIPSELINFFRDNADNQYIPTIDLSKPLIDQKISRETEVLLCLINLNYWCTLEEKDELLKKYEINEKEAEEQLRNTYEIKFNKSAKIEDVKAIAVIEKENMFTKILKFFKGIITKKK